MLYGTPASTNTYSRVTSDLRKRKKNDEADRSVLLKRLLGLSHLEVEPTQLHQVMVAS